jgi:hypothetical protein
VLKKKEIETKKQRNRDISVNAEENAEKERTRHAGKMHNSTHAA